MQLLIMAMQTHDKDEFVFHKAFILEKRYMDA
jgi:hypothetical protein